MSPGGEHSRRDYRPAQDQGRCNVDSEKLFDMSTASAKVGQKIRALVKFPAIPQGSTGMVVCARPERDGFLLGIQWKVPGTETEPPMLWFTRQEYNEFLAEID